MSALDWRVGAPSARGSYWVVWQQKDGARIVIPVDISPAMIHWNDPNARLLLKELGGMAYGFEENKTRVLFHMPMIPPALPSDSVTDAEVRDALANGREHRVEAEKRARRRR